MVVIATMVGCLLSAGSARGDSIVFGNFYVELGGASQLVYSQTTQTLGTPTAIPVRVTVGELAGGNGDYVGTLILSAIADGSPVSTPTPLGALIQQDFTSLSIAITNVGTSQNLLTITTASPDLGAHLVGFRNASQWHLGGDLAAGDSFTWSSDLLTFPALSQPSDFSITLSGMSSANADGGYLHSFNADARTGSFNYIQAVPLPPSVWAGGCLMGGLALMRMRRQRSE